MKGPKQNYEGLDQGLIIVYAPSHTTACPQRATDLAPYQYKR